MAEFLASIFGTEKDRVNCPFYFKTGACTHGERCSRQHNRPTYSQTVLLNHMYRCPVNFTVNPELKNSTTYTEEYLQQHFDEFFEDIYLELEEKYGKIEEINVCENLGDHLIGNVYVMFKEEEAAQLCVDGLNNRWYSGAPIYAELSPVTDFREACCRQHETAECTRGGYCNFLHAKACSKEVKYKLGLDHLGKGRHVRKGARRSFARRSRSPRRR